MSRLHRRKKICFGLFVLLDIFFAAFAPAQSPCAQELAAANQRYGDGDFTGAITAIQRCLEKTEVAAPEKITAYALLTRIYIAVEDTAQARRAALQLLAIAPNYQPDANDSPEFNNLVDALKKQRRPPPTTPVVKPKKSGKKWWWIGGAAATTAGAAAIILSRNEPRKQTDTGFTNPPPRP